RSSRYLESVAGAWPLLCLENLCRAQDGFRDLEYAFVLVHGCFAYQRIGFLLRQPSAFHQQTLCAFDHVTLGESKAGGFKLIAHLIDAARLGLDDVEDRADGLRL